MLPMLIPNKYDLILLGNIIIDEVYSITKWAEQGTSNIFQSHRTSVGGIGNMIEAMPDDSLHILVEAVIGKQHRHTIEKYFQAHSVDTLLHHSKMPTSTALILSNLELGERTSFVNWGCGTELFTHSNQKSRWTHISYLDTSSPFDIAQIRQNSDVISADLCLSDPSPDRSKYILDQLQHLDYLFASDAEMRPLLRGNYNTETISLLVKQYRLKNLIHHTKHKTIVIKDEHYNEVSNIHPLIKNVNVLGAGDAYCAAFIHHQLRYDADILKSVAWAHQQANKFILNRI